MPALLRAQVPTAERNSGDRVQGSCGSQAEASAELLHRGHLCHEYQKVRGDASGGERGADAADRD